jgi:hypothetical protein
MFFSIMNRSLTFDKNRTSQKIVALALQYGVSRKEATTRTYDAKKTFLDVEMVKIR